MAPSDGLQPDPLTEAAFFIPLSQGRILFSAGTLYGGLKRFLRRDWIRRVHGKGKDESGRPRKEMEKSRPLAVRRFANGALGAGIGGLLGLGCAGLA